MDEAYELGVKVALEEAGLLKEAIGLPGLGSKALGFLRRAGTTVGTFGKNKLQAASSYLAAHPTLKKSLIYGGIGGAGLGAGIELGRGNDAAVGAGVGLPFRLFGGR